ncbi:MAG: DUF5060 domain-containing protein [Bryobacteraceae bacterium]
MLRHTLLALAIPAALSAAPVERFGIFDLTLESQSGAGNPYLAISADANLLGPGGASFSIPLFWDGGTNWRLRFSPQGAGRWTFSVKSNDPALNGRKGAFFCDPSNRPGGLRPSQAWPGHFERANGTPVWFLGDTAWGYLTDNPDDNHYRAQAELHARTRAAQGFNVFHVMALSEQGVGNNGGLPFADLDAQVINPAYWREVDRRIAFANANGITAAMALAWGNKRNIEPFSWGRFPNVEARKRYARYMAARYCAFDVYFIVAGEWHGEVRNRKRSSEHEVFQEFVEIGDTLAAADPHRRMIAIHPMTAHGSTREFGAAGWMSFADYQQNYRDLHQRTLAARTARGPVVNSEYGYHLRDQDGDGKPDKANSYSLEDIRFASWDIAMAGGYMVTGFGTTYFGGHRDPGPWNIDDPKNDAWEAQVSHMKNFFSKLEFWRLSSADDWIHSPEPRLPDRTDHIEGAAPRQSVHPPARTWWALADPGRAYVVYVRGARQPITLEFHAHLRPYLAREFNPRSGEFRPIEPPAGSTYVYRPPSDDDWVVLLQAREKK